MINIPVLQLIKFIKGYYREMNINSTQITITFDEEEQLWVLSIKHSKTTDQVADCILYHKDEDCSIPHRIEGPAFIYPCQPNRNRYYLDGVNYFTKEWKDKVAEYKARLKVANESEELVPLYNI